MSYKRFDTEDVVVSAESVTAPVWSNDTVTLTTFFTSSTQIGGTSADYYYDVYQTSSTLDTARVQFSIAYETELRKDLTLDVELNYLDKKYVSNDQENIEPQIPDYYFVNTYLSSENTNYTLNFGINNLFDEAAYDFAVSSTFHDDAHYGLSNVYPLPGRNLFFDLAYTF